MEEATEIARLRLFLALVARLQTRAMSSSLCQTLTLNVRAGNLLVGVTTPTDAERQFEGSLLASERLPKVVERAHGAAALYRDFVDVQSEGGDGARLDALKGELRIVGDELSEELDRLSSSVASDTDLDDWRKSHQPFHWFIEFPDVISSAARRLRR